MSFIDTKDLRISKMSALKAAVDVHIANLKDGGLIDLSDVVEDAERLVSWIINPSLKYVKSGTKETKGE